MEQTVIKINVQDTIDQIVDLSDKIEALKELQKQYKKELKELKKDETANAKAIQEKSK